MFYYRWTSTIPLPPEKVRNKDETVSVRMETRHVLVDSAWGEIQHHVEGVTTSYQYLASTLLGMTDFLRHYDRLKSRRKIGSAIVEPVALGTPG